MTKRKTKFLHSINFSEFELGDKNRVLQTYEEWEKLHSKGKMMPPRQSIDIKNNSASQTPVIPGYVHGAPDELDVVNSKENKEYLKDALPVTQANTEIYKQKVADVGNIRTTAAQLDANAKNLQGVLDKNKKELQAVQDEDKTKLEIAKIQQDPNEISQTEMNVFNIIKKYDFLKDPEAFKNLINTTSNNTIKADGITLERDLVKLGMNLTVGADFDQRAIDKIEALISKKAPAIKAYEEVTGVNPIKKSTIER